jgi:hypothetical protein
MLVLQVVVLTKIATSSRDQPSELLSEHADDVDALELAGLEEPLG